MLIVLEGLDGAGKSTQLELLRKYAASRGRETAFMHFPRFETPFYGELIARFLRGEFGAAGDVDPYTVAFLFAGDRAANAPVIREWLDEGRWVILDRYVYSNVAFQGAKIDDPLARRRLSEWILDLEFGIWGIPRPDVSLFLDVPIGVVEARLAGGRTGADRAYLDGGEDVHEASIDFQRRVREVYLDVARVEPALKVVDCSDGTGGPDGVGGMASPEAIHARILNELGGL